MGLTNLDGAPVMCVLIIAGKRAKAMTELGIDPLVEMIGLETDEDFLKNNSGEGKMFPGGPTCMVKGTRVPCFIRWTPKGSITSEILRDALATLDHLKVFPRANGLKPFLLVDGHGSRFELPFLRYINTAETEWVVCIGVPYGTGLWQVGDSKEQNGSYNIAMTQAKEKLLAERESKCIHATIESYDIIPLVNTAWAKSFARVAKNQNAIADRGWLPFNRNLLTLPDVRATMTSVEREEENLSEAVTPSNACIDSILDLTAESPTFDPAFLKMTTYDKSWNYTNGVSAFCVDALVSHQQLMQSRERAKKERDNGKTTREKLEVGKRVTASVLFHAKTARLGMDVFDIQDANYNDKIAEEKEKIENRNTAYRAAKAKADAFILTGKDHEKWTIADLKVVLAPLKPKEDGPMPAKKTALWEKYKLWMHRPPFMADEEELTESDKEEPEVNDVRVGINIGQSEMV